MNICVPDSVLHDDDASESKEDRGNECEKGDQTHVREAVRH